MLQSFIKIGLAGKIRSVVFQLFYEYKEGITAEDVGIRIHIYGKAGESYLNKALDLDAMLDIGDTITFKTREQEEKEREVY